MIRDLAIDLGTANTLIWVRGRGVVLREPTVIAVDQRRGRVLAAGSQAFSAVQAGDQLVVERPLAGGAVTDFETASRFLALLLERLGVTRRSRARVIVGVPCGVTDVERRALEDAARRAGAGRAHLLEEPMAAAIGAGLPVQEPTGTMVVDLGGGNTEVAVISLGGVVTVRAVRVGGFDLDLAIQRHVQDHHGIAIGDRTAEELKIALGSAYPQAEEGQAEVRGRDLDSGGTRAVTVHSEEVRAALDPLVARISATVVDTLSECPPELSQDVMASGMLLVGGGALLRGLDERIARETQVKVRVADSPLDAVVIGAGRALESLDHRGGDVFS